MSLNPRLVTMKTPLARKVVENHLMTSLPWENIRALSLISATLKLKYAMLFIWKVGRPGVRPKVLRFLDKRSPV